jgi:sulfatase modifying factor 1
MKKLVSLLHALMLIPTPFVVASTVVIDTVPIRYAGNTPDATTGFGSVAYNYRIARYEVTLSQYVEFLNAVADFDTHGLYNTSMTSTAQVAGVDRIGVPGAYVYSALGDPARPITFVNWFDAARFANWMSNGQPSGAQDTTTTEDGAYTLVPPFDHVGFVKNGTNPNTRRPPLWWIPSEDEWYKAAYHNPTLAAGLGGYHFYPIQSPFDNVPYSAAPSGAGAPDAILSGNFLRDDAIVNGYNEGYAVTGSSLFPATNALSWVMSYPAPTFYGTFDQGGNVAEITDGTIDSGGTLRRVSRGGSWMDTEVVMRSNFRLSTSPTVETMGIGFRLATAEPTAQRIRFATPRRSQLRVGNRFRLNVSSDSGLAVTVRSSAPSVLSVRGSIARVRRSGRVVLTASQAGDPFALRATPVVKRLTVR